MSFTEKLKSLRTAPNAMATLTYSEGTDVFLMNEDEVDTALSNTDVVEQFAELVTTPGLTVTTPFGTNIIQELRNGGFLDEYERGSFSFSEFIGETIRENFYDLDFIESSITKYDYKRGFCTLTAEVKIPVEDLIMESPFVGSWSVSVPTENGTITLN
jgi:hypothetical protein